MVLFVDAELVPLALDGPFEVCQRYFVYPPARLRLDLAWLPGSFPALLGAAAGASWDFLERFACSSCQSSRILCVFPGPASIRFQMLVSLLLLLYDKCFQKITSCDKEGLDSSLDIVWSRLGLIVEYVFHRLFFSHCATLPNQFLRKTEHCLQRR